MFFPPRLSTNNSPAFDCDTVFAKLAPAQRHVYRAGCQDSWRWNFHWVHLQNLICGTGESCKKKPGWRRMVPPRASAQSLSLSGSSPERKNASIEDS